MASQDSKIYNGHSTMNTSFFQESRQIEAQAQVTMNQLAKMRFSIQCNKAKKQNQMKEAEIEEYTANFDKMISNQNFMRRT